MNILTKENLKEAIKSLLPTWNNEKVEINDDTIIGLIVSSDDGFDEDPSSAPLFYGAVNWIIWANGGKRSEWPEKWLAMTVDQLAEYIIENQEQ